MPDETKTGGSAGSTEVIKVAPPPADAPKPATQRMEPPPPPEAPKTPAQKRQQAYNDMNVKISLDGSTLYARDKDGNVLPREKMTTEQRDAFDQMLELHEPRK